MSDDAMQIVERVTAEVLEQCAFLLTTRAQRIAEWCAKDPLHAVVEFRGPRTGWLRLSAPRELVKAIATDMLGDDAGDAAVEAAALCEIANIIVGVLLAELFGSDAPFELGIPHTPSEPPGTPAFAERLSVTLVTESAQPFESVLVLVARARA